MQRMRRYPVVIDEAPYRVEASADFHPWRRNMKFLPCQEVPIRPLIEELEFIRNKQRWGIVFRRGLFEIGEADFQKISRAMGRD